MNHPPTIDDPAAQPWSRQNETLVIAFTLEVHGPDAYCHLLNQIYLGVAARQIWSDSHGQPSWARALDPVSVLAELEEDWGIQPEAHLDVLATLAAFYFFLANSGELSGADCARLLRELQPSIRRASEANPERLMACIGGYAGDA